MIRRYRCHMSCRDSMRQQRRAPTVSNKATSRLPRKRPGGAGVPGRRMPWPHKAEGGRAGRSRRIAHCMALATAVASWIADRLAARSPDLVEKGQHRVAQQPLHIPPTWRPQPQHHLLHECAEAAAHLHVSTCSQRLNNGQHHTRRRGTQAATSTWASPGCLPCRWRQSEGG